MNKNAHKKITTWPIVLPHTLAQSFLILVVLNCEGFGPDAVSTKLYALLTMTCDMEQQGIQASAALCLGASCVLRSMRWLHL